MDFNYHFPTNLIPNKHLINASASLILSMVSYQSQYLMEQTIAFLQGTGRQKFDMRSITRAKNDALKVI